MKLHTPKLAALTAACVLAFGIAQPALSQAMARMEPTQRERMALGAVVMRAAGPVLTAELSRAGGRARTGISAAFLAP